MTDQDKSQRQTVTLGESVRMAARLAVFARPYWSELARSVLAGAIVGAVALIPPYLSKILIDEAYPSREFDIVPLVVSGILAVTLSSTLLDAARRYYTQGVTSRLTAAFTLLLFNHIQHQPLKFFNERQTGDILMRGTELRGALNSLTGTLLQVITSAAHVLLIPPVLLIINWQLAALALFVYPVTAAVTLLSGSWLRRHWKASAEASAAQNAFQIEAVSHIRTVKAGALEPVFFGRASELARTAVNTQLTAGGAANLVGVVNSVIRAVAAAVFTWYAWRLILSDTLSLGEFMLFTAYLGMLAGPVAQLTGFAGSFQQLAVTIARAFEILDSPPEQAPGLNASGLHARLQGAIELRNVSFGYRARQSVLSDVSLRISAGSVVAIVGRSGVGKSSLLHLMIRTIQPDSGEVLIDGHPASRLDLQQLRRQVAVAWQDAELFRASVRANLTLGLDQVSEADLDHVVRICRLDALIADLPHGLETVLGERGTNLSGGQRQRLAVARAILRPAPIILLDEAMSQVDARMEEEIVADILQHLRGRTVVLVTHRITTAARASEVIVLEDGRIVATGDHVSLQAHLAYRRLMDVPSAGGDANTPIAAGWQA
jgi:ABC-type bacteriocin/lantibiotic exporter with double-glycine peptidase domain